MSGSAHDHAVGGHHFAHHFKSADHEFTTSKQGLWLFLLQEVLFFSGLFLAYMIIRLKHPAMFSEASKMLDVRMGGANTIVLITSSLTMALAVNASQRGLKRHLTWYLSGTLALAGTFLVVKYFEYSAKFHHGLLPGSAFHNAEFKEPLGHLFFSLYFMMTGVHGAHVVGGMIALAWLIRRSMRGDFDQNYYTPVEMVGLYWHFVDLVWIYLFPLLYLVG